MAGIVLAGGRSSRMGRDKAVLEWDGERLIDRVVRVVLSVAQPVIVVAEMDGKYNVAGSVVGDDFPGAGPLGGIVTGLRRAGAGVHLVVACDMPAVEPDLLRLLSDRCRGHDAAVAWIEDRPEPLCAAYDSRCLDTLERELAAGRRAVHRALEAIDVARVEEVEVRTADPSLRSFLNVNEPSDLHRLEGLSV